MVTHGSCIHFPDHVESWPRNNSSGSSLCDRSTRLSDLTAGMNDEPVEGLGQFVRHFLRLALTRNSLIEITGNHQRHASAVADVIAKSSTTFNVFLPRRALPPPFPDVRVPPRNADAEALHQAHRSVRHAGNNA